MQEAQHLQYEQGGMPLPKTGTTHHQALPDKGHCLSAMVRIWRVGPANRSGPKQVVINPDLGMIHMRTIF